MSTVSRRYPLAVALCVTFAAAPVLCAAANDARAIGTQAAPTQRTAQSQRQHTGTEVRVSKLIGTAIHDARGKRLGDVKDVILDTNSGRVHYAVLSFGGFLGLHDKLFAVPLSKLHAGDKGRLILDATSEQIESAPAFESARWPDWQASGYRAEVDRRYGATPAEAHAKFRRASDLLKAQVRDANGADIGDIKDVVVDIAQSRVHYVVVEFDRAWNPHDKLVALPMEALRAVATAPPPARNADSAAPPRNPPEVLSLETPGGPSRGTASATDPPSGVRTTPPAIEPKDGVARIDTPALGTTTSYADDEDLYFDGTREQLKDAPQFDRRQYPDLTDTSRRAQFDRRLSRP
jgi:sporulation protein YlmC with PRC-barrel domain